jgi:hypothetical protein
VWIYEELFERKLAADLVVVVVVLVETRGKDCHVPLYCTSILRILRQNFSTARFLLRRLDSS